MKRMAKELWRQVDAALACVERDEAVTPTDQGKPAARSGAVGPRRIEYPLIRRLAQA